LTTKELAQRIDITSAGIDKHIKLLEKTGLIRKEKLDIRGSPNRIVPTEKLYNLSWNLGVFLARIGDNSA
jgi:DNA-binding MarR family transcriptional regulator